MKELQLLRRLESAGVCCKDCGSSYGIYSVGSSSTWMGVCHVCGQERPVTETRDYGYLLKGRKALALQIQERKL